MTTIQDMLHAHILISLSHSSDKEERDRISDRWGQILGYNMGTEFLIPVGKGMITYLRCGQDQCNIYGDARMEGTSGDVLVVGMRDGKKLSVKRKRGEHHDLGQIISDFFFKP